MGMEKGEEKCVKLRSEGAKRGGQRTPILPYWRFLGAAAAVCPSDGTVSFAAAQDFILPIHPPPISARKLAASLWEHNHYRFHLSNMNNSSAAAAAAADDAPLPRLRRLQHRRRQDKPLSPPSSPDLGSASTLKRHIAASMIQHHRSVERNNRGAIAIQPVTPASYCSSSMEVTPYNPTATPVSSMDLKPGYNLKTSTELLKVLNRIWSLEEQHAANMSLVKTLKKDLDRSGSKIKELVREQQFDKNEIDELRNQIEEDKVVMKNKEQELVDERRLRKCSESIHRKMKSSILKISKEVENERGSRILLEDLCDEFALGIRDYEKEVHSLRQKSDKNRNRDRDCSILHISESWIDERMQMKLGEQQQQQERVLTVEKLRPEIETFLKSRQEQKGQNLRRSSLNVAISAPQAAIDDESIGSDSHCFELNQKLPIRVAIEEGEGIKPTHVIGDLIRSQFKSNPDWRTRASPIREWKPTLPSRVNEISEAGSGSKLPPELKENTLKSKLMEARLRGKQMSRLKGSKSKGQL